ncbi:MAG: hypothetical protein OMM_14160, partial [Candidatus Magnetoglobus multicellularis str. Araruama]
MKSYTFTVSDADGGELTVTCHSSALTLVSLNGMNLSVTNSTEANLTVQAGESRELTLTITPVNNQFGTTTITLTVTDASGLSAVTTYDITYNSQADAPEITCITSDTIEEGAETSYTLTISDADGGNVTVTCSSSALTLVTGSGMNLSETTTTEAEVTLLPGAPRELTLTLTPEAAQNGVTTISLTVTDADGLSNVTTLVLTVTSVNDAPTISTLTPSTIEEDEIKSYTFTVSDADGGELTVTCHSSALTLVSLNGMNLSVTNSTEANLTVQAGESRELTLTITPVNNQFGTTTITLTVTDASGLSAVTTYDITYNSQADAPEITCITSDTIEEGAETSY